MILSGTLIMVYFYQIQKETKKKINRELDNYLLTRGEIRLRILEETEEKIPRKSWGSDQMYKSKVETNREHRLKWGQN